MKGSSRKVIMGATVVMLVTLAIVLALVLVLLAELYCSLLMRTRHHRRKRSASNATAVGNNEEQPQQSNRTNGGVLESHRHPFINAPSLNMCSYGVLRAPRSFLCPAPENLRLHLPTIHHYSSASPDSATTSADQQLIYICNPIYYDDDEATIKVVDTPFETPPTSPSHLDTAAGGSPSTSTTPPTPTPTPTTPPLTPMKKLPPEGPSVSLRLRDAPSICCTTASDSNTNNDGISSSSSASPRTSPSW